ncbi:MAG: hypothetical protein ACI83Y_001139 [Candidatus Azotimanducaceae bacterium]|jgi:uncharacterized protein
MVDLLRPLRINAVELLRRPGATLPVIEEISAEALGVVHERLNGEIDVAIELESMNDGIAVTGTVGAPWSAPCRRCLKDLSGVAQVDIDERYQIDTIDEEAYPIDNGQLDLVPMVRELALIELDAEQVCQPDCKGLCPACGIDWNRASCNCDNTVTDHRWSSLDGLVLDD